MLISETVHRGTLQETSIGASIFVAACELVGIHPGRPDVRLRARRAAAVTGAPVWLVRLFRLTRHQYFADFFITPPLTVVLAAASLRHDFGWRWLPLFALGWAFWTLYEYVVHRASHEMPWLVDVHWLHHRNTKEYIGLPPELTLALYATAWLAFGFKAAPFAVGFSFAYIAYAALHTAFHYAHIRPGHPLDRMKQRHVAHHRFHDRCFGVTTGLWDRALGTE